MPIQTVQSPPASKGPVKKADETNTDNPLNTLTLPDAVRDKLESIGIHGDDGTEQLQVQADLDVAGRWGERYLVATA